jgi:hypothetical protein
MRDERSTPEQERQGRSLDARGLSPAPFVPISPATRRRRRWTLTFALIAGLVGGTGLSVIPLPQRDVMKTGNMHTGRLDLVPRRWIQARHGFPFNTWTVETTPLINGIVTDKRIDVSPSGVILNAAVAAFVALLLLVPKKRNPEA